MRFSVVIPAYREAHRIAGTVAAVLELCRCRGGPFEVIVVDDGSTDGTGLSAREAAQGEQAVKVLEHSGNRGKGAAVRTGVLASRGDRVLVTDADLSTPLSELPRLERLLDEGYDVAIGSRGARGATLVQRQPVYREAAGRAGNLAIRMLCPRLWDLADTQCGFKLFRGEVARKVFAKQRLDRWGFDVEVLHLARTLGYRVAETPVTWAHCPGSKVRPSDYFRTLLEVASIRWNDILGRYE